MSQILCQGNEIKQLIILIFFIFLLYEIIIIGHIKKILNLNIVKLHIRLAGFNIFHEKGWFLDFHLIN